MTKRLWFTFLTSRLFGDLTFWKLTNCLSTTYCYYKKTLSLGWSSLLKSLHDTNDPQPQPIEYFYTKWFYKKYDDILLNILYKNIIEMFQECCVALFFIITHKD